MWFFNPIRLRLTRMARVAADEKAALSAPFLTFSASTANPAPFRFCVYECSIDLRV